MKEQFIKFLKKHGALRKFKTGLLLAKFHNCRNIDSYWNYLHTEQSVILNAFTWNDTKEGYNYWSNLSGKWENSKKK